MKSNDWLDRQKRDFYYKKAKNSGYVSRAAFKILEIEKKFKLISNSKKILEIGSSPGGWSQTIFDINEKIHMCAFDLLDMKFNHPNLNFFKEDFLNFDYSKLPYKFDLILSDIAPNTTGHQSTDHLRIASMIDDLISTLEIIALPSSSLVFKIWKGPYLRDENYNPYLANPFLWTVETSPTPIMWLYFNYYGKHLMIVQASDDAYYDYLSGDPLGINQYILPDSNIEGGYGLFTSTYSKAFFLNINKAD